MNATSNVTIHLFSEVKAALKSIKRGKALGFDDIPSIFLKESRTLITINYSQVESSPSRCEMEVL
jgi:hypothetical protein